MLETRFRSASPVEIQGKPSEFPLVAAARRPERDLPIDIP